MTFTSTPGSTNNGSDNDAEAELDTDKTISSSRDSDEEIGSMDLLQFDPENKLEPPIIPEKHVKKLEEAEDMSAPTNKDLQEDNKAMKDMLKDLISKFAAIETKLTTIEALFMLKMGESV